MEFEIGDEITTDFAIMIKMFQRAQLELLLNVRLRHTKCISSI